MYYQIFHTFIGDFFGVEQNGEMLFLHQDASLLPSCAHFSSTPLLKECSLELEAYFKKKLQVFSLPFRLKGSEFEQNVYHALMQIPYAHQISYQELANEIGSGARAVGGALKKNPLLLLVPCHRIVCKNGKLGGFVLGESAKRALLELEKAKA